jgi:predicted Zn-dependent protease
MINEGDFKKAEEKIKELMEKSPDDIIYNGLFAEIYRRTGDAEKAIMVYNKMLEKNPGNPIMLLSLSDVCLSEKKYKEFFKILNNIVISDSISREEKISLMARTVEDSNLVLSHSKEMENALRIFEEANKNDNVVILLRTDLYQKQNNIPGAIERLEEIIKNNPDNYYAWEKLLLLYSDTKDWNKLFIRGEECATKFNRSFIAKILYANASIEKNRSDIAVDELRKAMILAGNDSDMKIQVLMMETDLFYRKREFNKCFEVFEEALKIRPDDILILNNYAYYLAEQGKSLKEAEKMAKLVIDKEKRNATYLDTYAWVLYKRGRYKDAQKIMEEVIKRDNKQDAEWYEHLGYIMKAENNCDKAVEYWKIAFKIDERKKELIKEIENCGNR